MSVQPSHRPTREWPLLVLALAVVAAICLPLWQTSPGLFNMFDGFTPDRFLQMLVGPEQIACYVCFAWAGFILLGRWWEVRRQRRAFDLNLLPTDEGTRILPEDARPLQRKVDQLASRGGPYIVANMIRLALGKYALSRSSPDVTEVVRSHAEVEQGRLVSSMATVHYLAWAIPALGFLGTVRGLAAGLTMSQQVGEDLQPYIENVTRNLNVAFDTTFIALLLSLVLMFFLHSVHREEEQVVIDSQQYCLEHLANRLYDPEAATPEAEAHSPRLATVTRVPG
jgi:biopolymer transport protein ExbB/TolQ